MERKSEHKKRTEKLKRCGKGIVLIGLLGRLLLALYIRNGGNDFLNSDSVLYLECRLACGLMVIIGYGMRSWAGCREEEKADLQIETK